MKQMQSAHHYTMRPSERRLLANAKMIIWTGPQMEFYLSKIIEQQADSTIIVSAVQAKKLTLLNTRNSHSHEHNEHAAATNNNQQGMIDPHIWLSTRNAIAISEHIATQLINYNPANAERYRENLRALLNKIEHTHNFIKTQLKMHQAPFIAYHDAFQYFENENGLNYIDAINVSDETGASLKHMQKIKKHIEKYNIHCLVYQAPKPAIINALQSQTSIKAVALDPLGMNIQNNKNAWFELMRQLTLNFSHCLSS